MACYLVVKLATDILKSGKTEGFLIESDLNILFAALSSYILELEAGDWVRFVYFMSSQTMQRLLIFSCT
jgi:hypothetical protein